VKNSTTKISATAMIAVFIFAGLACRSETQSAFNREFLSDRRQLGLYGLTILLTILGTELGFLQRLLGLTELTGQQWLLCVVVASSLLVLDEVVKFFMRRRRSHAKAEVAVVAPVPSADRVDTRAAA